MICTRCNFIGNQAFIKNRSIRKYQILFMKRINYSNTSLTGTSFIKDNKRDMEIKMDNQHIVSHVDNSSSISAPIIKIKNDIMASKSKSKTSLSDLMQLSYVDQKFADVIKHFDVFTKKGHVINLDDINDSKLLDIILVSVESLNNPVEFTRIVDQLKYVENHTFKSATIHKYMDCCSTLKNGWLLASEFLNHIKYNDNDWNREDLSNWYLHAITLCSKYGKWRTAIDLLKLIQVNKMEFNSKVLSITVSTCCKDGSSRAMTEAFSIFSYMVEKSIQRDYDLYNKLLFGLIRENMLEQAESVWIQLTIDCSVTGHDNPFVNSPPITTTKETSRTVIKNANIKIQLNDILYSAFISILCGLKQYEKAIRQYRRVYRRFKNPIHSYVAIYNGLKQGIVENELTDSVPNKDFDLIIELAMLKQEYAVKLTPSYIVTHVRNYLDQKQYKQAIEFMTLEVSAISQMDSNLVDSQQKEQNLVPENLWNQVFNTVLEQGLLEESVKLYRYLVSRESTSNPEKDFAVSATSHIKLNNWLTKLILELGKSGNWEDAVHLAHR